jgi:CubicO group peptidase (beta-lactamase class C family)
VDPYGNFQLTGYDFGTARNWARIALLYLRDGVWDGERLLPEGFVDFVSTPAPAWSEPVYGGLFWINGTSAMPIPETAYYASGGGGQRTIIIPSHDLAVVRLGHFRGSGPGMNTLNEALALLMTAIPPAP